MSPDLERRLGELARRQHGVVTRVQLLALGMTPGGIRRRAAEGALRRLHRGVFLVGPILPPRGREMAAVLACGRRALLADRSAAALWGMLPPPKDGAEAVQVLSVGAAAERPGIRVRRVPGLEARDRAQVEGVPVTSPVRTLLDLAAVVDIADLEQAVARAEREHLVRCAELSARVAARKGRPGAPALRAVLERAGGPALTRSEAERRCLDLLRSAQLPPPSVNVRVAGYELDFLWPDCGIALEVEGYRFHATRSSFESDRRRATRLASHGIHVVAITWRQIVEEGTATAVRVAEALLHARFQRGRA